MASRPGMSPTELSAAEASFEGNWEDDEGTVVAVKDGIIWGPDGMNIPIQYLSVKECRFESDDTEYIGKLDKNGNIHWQDGSEWFRSSQAMSNEQAQHEEDAAAELPPPQQQRHAPVVDSEDAGVKDVAGADHVRQAFDEERARKAAALERARATKAAAEAHMGSPESDRTRQAGEEEKARKAAILERARARAAGARQGGSPSDFQPPERSRHAQEDDRATNGSASEHMQPQVFALDADDTPASPNAGVDRAKQALEEEKARKAAALERAKANLAASRARASEADEAKTRSDAGVDRTKQAYEEEKARRAAALERARANAAAAANAKAPDMDEGRARSEAGVSKARQAFEDEKARRAAALERARSNAAQARDTNGGEQAASYMGEAKAKSDAGIDRARKAFEEEKARKAAALERAREMKEQTSARSQAATATNSDGMDRAKQAFEEEKARKAAAIERARAKVAEAAAASGGGSSGGGGSERGGAASRGIEDAKAKSQAGMDKARQAFEAEKARKAAALDRARAKAAQATEADAGSRRVIGDRPGGFSRLGGRAGGVGGGLGGGNAARGGFGGLGQGGRLPGRGGYLGGFGAPGGMMMGEDEPLLPGTFIRLEGLKARPELNGKVGMLIKFDEKKGRWQVRVENRDDMLLKEDNLVPLSQDEYEEIQEEAEQEEIKVETEAKAIRTRAVGGKMRWCDEEREGAIERGPGEEGNEFDVLMADETDGVDAAEKIVDCLAEQGVCLCEANAPHQLLSDAFDEAEDLWQAGDFGPPMKVFDEDGQIEAQVWKDVLYQDENKVIWINPEEPQPRIAARTQSLKTLSENMLEFCRGLGDPLQRKTGIRFTHLWNGMLSCYTGDRTYSVHLDNPHACGQDAALPDNGLRLTLVYYINVHWNPVDEYNGGGMDVFLTDSRSAPASAAAARRAPRVRVAPHADTLAIFLSERMVHQVIPTKGKDRWYSLTMWCFDQDVMNEFLPKMCHMRGLVYGQGHGDEQEDSDSDLD